MSVESLIAVAIGIGLAAASGLRVFLPLLVACVAARWGVLPLSEGFQWLSTTDALVALATASAVEVAAYYIPGVDHLMDVVATPAVFAAGPPEMVIDYRRTGGFGNPCDDTVMIHGETVANVMYMTKCSGVLGSQGLRIHETTLDGAAFAELKAIFDAVHFDTVDMRSMRREDFGTVSISRQGGGHRKKEVASSDYLEPDADITLIYSWFSDRMSEWDENLGRSREE